MKTQEVYISKKDPDVTAKVVKRPNDTTVILEYLTGDETGNTTSITVGTLKRYWKASTEKSTEEILGVDMAEVNEPYPEPTEKKYIPKPDSVVEYEEKNKKRYNSDLVSFEQVVEDLSSVSSKVNSGYVKLKDNATTVWRKNGWIDVYADEVIWTALTNAGFASKPNKDKDRPYSFRFNNNEGYEKLVAVIEETLTGGDE